MMRSVMSSEVRQMLGKMDEKLYSRHKKQYKNCSPRLETLKTKQRSQKKWYATHTCKVHLEF